MSYSYPVILKQSNEGVAAGCPALPGCWSQGATEEEALENIKIAIAEYLSALKEIIGEEDVREVEVAF